MSMTVHRPTCFLQENLNEYQILLELGLPGHLNLYLSRDHKRLHVVAENSSGAAPEQYLWSFQVPHNADEDHIGLECKSNLYLIHLPKKRAATEPFETSRSVGSKHLQLLSS